ncbi:22043_t:CDS:2, partial [Entrophospora sp. SA101]
MPHVQRFNNENNNNVGEEFNSILNYQTNFNNIVNETLTTKPSIILSTDFTPPSQNYHSSSVNIQKPSSSTNTTTMINDNNNIVNIKSKEKDGSHPIASIDSLMINRSFNSGERCTANNNRSNDREIDDFKKERDNDHRVAEDKINYFSPQNQYEKVKRQLFEENNNTQMLENDYKSKTNELEQKCLQILKSLQQRYDNLPVESNNDNNSNILTAE